ncbi:MAG: TIGR04283 family arsenosugar biosynthesis glycosyltransferase [Flavobacteriales bacterium]
MTLSIIIPCYNEEALLSSKIPTLLKITEESTTEIIVVDCPKSDDDTKKLMDNFPSVFYHTCENSGRAQQMNFGATKAKNSVLLFLHADVTLPENYFSLISNHIQNYDFGLFNYQFDKSNFWMRVNSSFVKNKKGLFTGGGDQCHFFKKETFDRLNGYDEEFCIMEDFEMMDRVKKGNIPYEVIQTPVTVSARKYEKNSWLKVNLVNGYVFISYKMGVTPSTLKKRYRSLTR